MSEHTSGPWRCDGSRWGYLAEGGAFSVQAADGSVVACRSEFDTRAKEMWANARLIAAAPDMLARLEQTAENLRELADDYTSEGDADIAMALNGEADRIDETIAKAKGQTYEHNESAEA